VISLLLDDDAAADVAGELAGQEQLGISVVNVTEILDVLRRIHRTAPADAALAVDRFLNEVAAPIEATRELALRAADVRARHYHRRDRDVSLADCFVVATASPDGCVATSDRAVARVAQEEGLDVLAMPSQHGRRPL